MRKLAIAIEQLMTAAEVAAVFRVHPKTVWRWSRQGRLSSVRTLGGHRRFRASEVERLLNGGARVSLTTRQIEQAAMAVSCPRHRVAAGKPCGNRELGALGGACLERREAALGSDRETTHG